jgi:hypothetical protein
VIITAKIWCDDTAVRLRGAQGPGGVREGHRRRRPLRAPPHRALRLRVELRLSTSSLAFFLHRARHQDKAEMTSLWMISDAAGLPAGTDPLNFAIVAVNLTSPSVLDSLDLMSTIIL